MTGTYVPEAGRHEDVPEETYHHEWDAMNASRLKWLDRSPYHYRYFVDNPGTQVETPSMKFGTAVHCAVCEPNRFDDIYRLDPTKPDSDVAYPPGWRNSKAYKVAKSDLLEHGYRVLDQNGFDACRKIRDRLWTEKGHHRDILEAVTGAEVSFALDCPRTGLRCKIRTDLLAPGIHVDLKTAESLSQFERSIFNFGYHLSAPFYQDLLAYHYPGDFDAHFFLVVEVAKSGDKVVAKQPFEFALYQLDEDAMDLGRRKVEKLMDLALKCTESNEWPGMSRDVQYIGLPGYAYTQEEKENS